MRGVVSPVLVADVLSVLAGATAVAVAVVVYRSFVPDDAEGYADLGWPFLVTVATVAVCAAGYPVLWRVPSVRSAGVLPLLVLLVAYVPWNVFAFRYAGRGTLVTRRRILAVGVLVGAAAAVVGAEATGLIGPEPGQSLIPSLVVLTSVVLLGLLAVLFVSTGLVLLAAYRHGGLSSATGVVVVFPVTVVTLSGQVSGQVEPLSPYLLAAAHLFVATVGFALAVTRYDVLTVRAGTNTLGERAVVDDMDEAVLVVDRRGDVVRTNREAERLFGPDVEGTAVGDAIGATVPDLCERNSIERWTRAGYRRFDPRVSTVTAGDREVGRTVTLLDVTDREIRRQRIQVLNRILRHNIRNELDVIKTRAELATDEGRDVEKQVAAIRDAADDLERLSASARRVETLMARAEGTDERTDLAALVESVVDGVTKEYPNATVSVDVPDRTVSLDADLLRYAVRNVVENAVEHNDGSPRVSVQATNTDAGVRVVVADDGPGIPESEREAIDTGSEGPLAHASSLGLWGTSWAVQALGGNLSLGDSDLGGAAVVFDLPDGRGDADDRPGPPGGP